MRSSSVQTLTHTLPLHLSIALCHGKNNNFVRFAEQLLELAEIAAIRSVFISPVNAFVKHWFYLR